MLCHRLCDPLAAWSDPLCCSCVDNESAEQASQSQPDNDVTTPPAPLNQKLSLPSILCTRPHRTILDFTNHLNFHQPSQPSPTIRMARGSDVLLVIVAIIFPPAAAAFITGCSCDLLINLLLTILVSRTGAVGWLSVNSDRGGPKWASPRKYCIVDGYFAWRRWAWRGPSH